MEGANLIKGRRSIRKFSDKPVDRQLISDVVEIARFAPSWKNSQVARYTFVDDVDKIKRIADEAVMGFSYNQNTLAQAKGVMILSFVNGISGKLDAEKEDYATSKGNAWEVFDAGIACQAFCLAAYEKGLSTCIFGVFDENIVPTLAGLPENETVAALIVCGYAQADVQAPPRKEVDELLRFAD